MDWDINDGVSDGGQVPEPDVLGTIDKYELLKELGTGGFGSVYLARDKAERRFVAVKGLPREMKDSAEELERIRRNFELIVQLKHDNIVALRQLHQVNNIAYRDEETAKKLNVERGQTLLVMDYAEGIPLSRWAMQFPEGKVPVDQAIEVTRQIAVALDYAHSHKIIHRDVKPQNVVMQARVDGTFVAQVLDFGLAAEVRSSLNRSSAGNRGKSGTRLYMPPEQWQGKEQKASADQYSLAVLFYELVLGKVPFQSAFDSGDPVVAMTAVTTQSPDIPEALPKPVRRALAVALAKSGDDRFASCADFVAALEGKRVAMPGGTRSVASAIVGLAAALALAAAGVWWWQDRGGTGTGGTPPPALSTNAVSSVQEVPRVSGLPVAPQPAPVDEEAERRRLELAAETAVYALSVEMESASQLIARESEDVRGFFEPEVRTFEKMRKCGNEAKSNKSYVAATNFFAQAKAKADALKELVTARANSLAAKERAEAAKRSADAVDAKSALALRYEAADKALGEVTSLAKKRDFAAASARAESARSQFVALRAHVISNALDAAGRHQAAERWEDCLAAAEKVLGWEPQNAAAAALKREAESHLVPSLRFVAKIGDREVSATAKFDGQTFKSPWVWEKNVRAGSRVPSSDVAVEYSEGDKRYVGTMKSVTVDWNGPKTMTVVLSEYKGPKAVVASLEQAEYSGTMREYVVKSGDTLGMIAYRNGINLCQLKLFNGLDSDMIRIGQKLKIPATKPEQLSVDAAMSTATYIVQDGDDMIDVASRGNVTTAEIRGLNNMSDDDKLVPGSVIKLPAIAKESELAKEFVLVMLAKANECKSHARWQECLEAVEKVLGWEPQNAAAAALKREAEDHLKPRLRFVAKIGVREVPATARFGNKTSSSPWKWDADLKPGSRIPSADIPVEYADGGKWYVGAIKPVTVDWQGLRILTVALSETTEPKLGDTKTITLPGGATMEMVWCPSTTSEDWKQISGGKDYFLMGSPVSECGAEGIPRNKDEAQHRVTLTKGFWMGKYEVTQQQWESVMGTNPSKYKDANLPVEQVSWDDCQSFVYKINHDGGVKVSLPTEAQFEYSCRAGTTERYGVVFSTDQTRFRRGGYPVGTSLAPNKWGLYDMNWNVGEWCQDWMADYEGDVTNPVGPDSGKCRVIRGGGFFLCRSAERQSNKPTFRGARVGLRLVCSEP